MSDTELARLQVKVERLCREYIAAKKSMLEKDAAWERAYQSLIVEQKRREFVHGIARINPFLVQ